MFRKRLSSAILACMLLFSCSLVPTMAVEAPASQIVMPRAAGRLDYTLSPGITLVGQEFFLEVGDTIKYTCTYTPKSASVDFGVIAPDGLFHFLNSTSGSIDKSFSVGLLGQYQLAIRNNASSAVTVTGTVKY